MPFIQLPNLNLHYEHNGQGDTVLLLVHGNFASWHWWQTLLTQLPGAYRAYAPDMRGFGDSEKTADGYSIEQLAADLYAFIQALELPKLHLVGHSLGGAVSLQLALDHPEVLHSLSLIAPAPAQGMPHLQTQQGFVGLLPNFSHFALLKSLDLNRSLLKHSLQKMLPSLDVRSAQFVRLLDDAARLPSHAVGGFLDSLSQWNVMARLADFDPPVLVIVGDADPIIDVQALQRMTAALPNAQLHVWEKVGHAIPIEHPAALQAALLQFIEQHQPAASPLKPSKTATPQAFKTVTPQALWQGLRNRLTKQK